jgi:class 3 adenylate cyclase/tetratricopeptide (TPR) repeat protein
MAIGEPEQGGEIRAFLIADVRGYTTFTVEHGDAAGARLAGAFAELMDKAAADAGGELLELRGDEALLTFSSSRQAVRAALLAQAACAERLLRDSSLPIRIGIGIDAGEAIPLRGGYRGKALNLAARLCSLAGVGEILVSEALVHLAGKLDNVDYEERGQVQLKGFGDPVTILGVRTARPSPPSASLRPAVAPPAQPVRLPIGSFLGALPSAPLVGRKEEAELLKTEVNNAVGGLGGLILLAGEPGAGKTRLAQEAFLDARNHGFALGVGSCLENRRAVPYYPFLDVLAALATAATSAGLDPFADRPHLRQLSGGNAVEPGATAGGQAEEERLRREVGSFVLELAAVQPVAIFLDDLHWADDSTLELFHHLARRSGADRVLLAGTYRDVEVGRQHPLERVLRELRHEDVARTITVRRLVEAGTAALVAASFGEEEISAEFAGLIHRQTDGNPFFIQQVCRALVERGDIYREDDRWERRKVAEIELPESIRSTIGERVSRLPGPTQELLATAAVLGQPFRFQDLLAMSAVSEEVIDSALGEAAAIGLLRSGDGELYSFDHALTHQTLLAEIPRRRHRRLHAEAARVLAETGGETRAAEIALHFIEGDDPAEAARWSLTAAEQARRLFAHREAEQHYRNAAELAAETGDAGLEARALAGLGEAAAALGQLDEALAALNRAAAHFRSAGDYDTEARVLAGIARIHRELTLPQPAIGLIRDFLARSEGAGDEALATVLAALGRLLWVAGDYDGMAEPARRAATLATAAENVGLRVEADLVLAQSLTREGDLEGARDLLARAYQDSSGTADLVDRVAITNNLAFAHFLLGDLKQNLVYRQRALELAEQFAHSASLCFAETMVGQALEVLGRMDAAEEHLDRAEAILGGLDLNRARSYLLTQQARVLLVRGDLAGVDSLLASVDAAVVTADLQLQTWTAAVQGEALTLGERAAEAEPMLRRQVEVCRQAQYRLTSVLVPLAAVLVQLGRLAEAAEAASEALNLARVERDGWVQMEAGHVLGVALAELGQRAEAEAAFAEVELRAARAPYPYLLARNRLELARSRAAGGDVEQARALAGQAVRGFADLGSALLLRQAEALVAELGGPGAKSPEPTVIL